MTRRQKISFILSGVALFFLLIVIGFGDNGLVEYNRKRLTLNGLVHANERLAQENKKLSRTIIRLQNDPLFIENTARRDLGMIRSNELIFQFSKKEIETNPKVFDQ